MPARRNFIAATLAGIATTLATRQTAATARRPSERAVPRVVSTWDFGVAANQAAWQVLAPFRLPPPSPAAQGKDS